MDAIRASGGAGAVGGDAARSSSPRTPTRRSSSGAARWRSSRSPDELVAAVEAIRDRADSTEACGARACRGSSSSASADPFVPVADARAIRARRPAELQVFEGCGHLPALERPDEFDRCCRRVRGALRVTDSRSSSTPRGSQEHLGEPDLFVGDVRGPNAHARGHIPGSKPLVLGSPPPASDEAVLAELAREVGRACAARA